MRPTQLKPDDAVAVTTSFGVVTGIFVKRIPAECGRPAVNIIRIPRFAGLNGPADDGICQFTDRDVVDRVADFRSSRGLAK